MRCRISYLSFSYDLSKQENTRPLGNSGILAIDNNPILIRSMSVLTMKALALILIYYLLILNPRMSCI